jgi:hypothetical protein
MKCQTAGGEKSGIFPWFWRVFSWRKSSAAAALLHFSTSVLVLIPDLSNQVEKRIW